MSEILADKKVSLTGLAQLTGVDRATLVKRLEHLPPSKVSAKLKQYRLADALRELLKRTNSELEEARIRRAKAEAALKELQLAREDGALLPATEVRDYATRLFAGMKRRIELQLVEEVLPALGQAQTREARRQALKAEVKRAFDELRDNHQNLL